VGDCYWPMVLWMCGETFYGLMFAFSAVGFAVSLAVIAALVFGATHDD
jgi:hypothetical protein